MARPKKEVDEKLVYDLASIMCTTQEIATICGVSHDTLQRRFASLIKEGHENGKSTLRRWQWNACAKGNPALLIWMGKQHLDQKDKHESEITGQPIQIVIPEKSSKL
jgi:hypothetical protein